MPACVSLWPATTRSERRLREILSHRSRSMELSGARSLKSLPAAIVRGEVQTATALTDDRERTSRSVPRCHLDIRGRLGGSTSSPERR
jgi:hypothetical protein